MVVKKNEWPARIERLLAAIGQPTGTPLPATQLTRELARQNPSCCPCPMTIYRWLSGTKPSYRYSLAIYELEQKFGIAKGFSPSQLIQPTTFPNES